MNRRLLILIIVVIILAGCTRLVPTESKEAIVTDIFENDTIEEKGIENIDKDIEPVDIEDLSQEVNSDDQFKAENAAQQFLHIIKERDKVSLLEVLSTDQLDLEQTNKIIEAFDKNFDLDTLSAHIYDEGYRMSIEDGQYEFILLDKFSNEFSEEKSLVIRYEEDGSLVYINPYVQYFPYVENMLLRYLELINKGSVTELARFLNADDLDVPEWVAEKTVKSYKDFFESEPLSIRYVNHFVFVIEGERGREHEIKVIYGDGLMSIVDGFIPAY